MMYQASKKIDFTVDLIWWSSLKLVPIKIHTVKLHLLISHITGNFQSRNFHRNP